jgi:hypothetical protein
VVHFSVHKASGYSDPIPNKEQLLFVTGESEWGTIFAGVARVPHFSGRPLEDCGKV